MAKLYVDGAPWGDVTDQKPDYNFPCIDTPYSELTWTFNFDKEFTTFEQLIAYAHDTVKSRFADRESNVSYGGKSESDMILVSLKLSEIISPTFASFEAVFSKENA